MDEKSTFVMILCNFKIKIELELSIMHPFCLPHNNARSESLNENHIVGKAFLKGGQGKDKSPTKLYCRASNSYREVL